MICAVYTSWLDRQGNWSPTHTKYIEIKDGDMLRAAKVVAKTLGELREDSVRVDGNEISFKVDHKDLLGKCTVYTVRIKPLSVEEV